MNDLDRIEQYYEATRMTVRELAQLLSTLDQEAKIEVNKAGCCAVCSDGVGRPQIISYEPGDPRGHEKCRVYVLCPYSTSYSSTRFLKKKGTEDIIAHQVPRHT